MNGIIRDLYKLVRPFGLRRLTIVFVCTLAQAVIQLLAVFSLLPFLSAASDMAQFRQSGVGTSFVAVVGPQSDSNLLVLAGVLSASGLLLSNVVNIGAEYLRGQYAFRFGHWMRVALIGNLMKRRYEYFLGTNSAVLLKNIVDDVQLLVSNILSPVLDVLARFLIVLMLSVVILVMEPEIFAIAFVVCAVYYVLVIRPTRMRAARTSDRNMVFIRALYREVNQMLTGMKPIMATNREGAFLARCDEASLSFTREAPKVPLYSAIPRAGLEILVFGGLILWVLVTVLSGGDLISLMPRVGLIAIIAYRLMPSLQLLFGQSMTIIASRQSMDEVIVMLNQQAEHQSNPSAALTGREVWHWDQSIRFENVSFSYAGASVPALEDITFEIPKGQRVAFVGPTGSGKSTLIDIILGLLQPSGGRILIDGKELVPDLASHWRQAIGYVPQDLFLYDASIAENIAFGLRDSQYDLEQVKNTARIAQAAEFIEQDGRDGFMAVVGERGVRLSGGQRQRIALARALYNGPNLLVLDEATSALDPRTERAVVEQLGIGNDRLTVISITHRLHTIVNYDQIHFIKEGRIVASGTYPELREMANFAEFSQ